MSRRLLLAATALFGALFALAGPAAAAGEPIVLRSVDTTEFPRVVVDAQVTDPDTAITDFTVRENGELVEDLQVGALGASDSEIGIVLVLDASESMNERGAFDAAVSAAKRFVDAKQSADRIALVVFGDEARTIVPFTDEAARLDDALDDLSTRGASALWEGVSFASELLLDEPDLQPNIVVLTDGLDDAFGNGDEARSAAIASKAQVSVVALTGDFDTAPLEGLADATGGTFAGVAEPAGIGDALAGIGAQLQNQFRLAWSSEAPGPAVDLVVSTGDVRATTTANIGTRAEGTATTPRVVEPSNGLLESTAGKLVATVLGALAVGLLAWVLASMLLKEESTLSSVLRAYEDAPSEFDGDERQESLVSTPLVQRAVAMTEEFATKRGFLSKVEWKLERADLPFRAPEALFFYAVGVVLLGVLSLVLAPSFFLGVIGIVLIAIAPWAAVNIAAGQRKRTFLSQLPDTLQLLSGSLRAGYSLMQGVEAVSQEVDGPMEKELRRVLTESRLGRPLEQSLEESAERMDSPDFAWAVMAIRIQREVGGNLAELLQTVAETMVSRERLRREVKALTAEGRISAIVLGLLPVGIGLAVWAMNRPYIQLLFDEKVGQYMLGGAVLLALVGFYWMKKTIEIEI